MEQLRIQINEVESTTFKIPTEFTGYTFNKFYNQLLGVGKLMDSVDIGGAITPKRFRMHHWENREESLEVLKIWEEEGKQKVIEWFKEKKNVELTPIEISGLSKLMVAIRAKYGVKRE
jgi:hypothetical protein